MEFTKLSDDDQLVKPTSTLEFLHKDSECQCEAEGDDGDEEGRECNNHNNIVPNLMVKISVTYHNKEGGAEKEDEDGFKTPTSCEHKIPVMLECPPAPRKPPPTLSSRKKKRKSDSISPNILLDSLFPVSPLLDLDGNIKKKLKYMEITPFTHL